MKRPNHLVEWCRVSTRLWLLLLLTPLVEAQSISGRVVDKDTVEPIPYVNIGVVRGQRGTVSTEAGLFHLNLSGTAEDALIRFSFIGYRPYDLTLSDLPDSSALIIQLEPILLQMREVLVFPQEFVEQIKGNPNPPKFIQAGFGEDSLGYELGVLIKIKKKPTLIKTLTLHNMFMSYDSVFYRLNVYEMQGRKPGRNVLQEPIYISFSQSEIEAAIEIDLFRYHIVVQDDFVISLEYVRELGEGSLAFGAGFLNGKTFYRRTSQAEWFSAPIGIGMSTLIRYAKD